MSHRPRLSRRAFVSAVGTTGFVGACATSAKPGATGAAVPAPRSPAAGPYDLILRGGRIWTQDPKRPEVEAIAIRDGKVAALGTGAALGDAATTVVELDDRRVIPGLNDVHMHPTRGGRFFAAELRWDGVESLERGLDMIRDQAKRTPPGQWVRVIGGWSPYQFRERRMPTPEELTKAAPDVPVFVLFLYSGGMLNRAAVDALGITPETPTPAGTAYEVVEGRVTGRLLAIPNPTLLYQTIGKLPPLTAEQMAISTQHYYRDLNRFGLTSVIDAGGGGHHFPEDYGGTQALADRGQMPIRISNFLFPQKKGAELEEFRRWTANFEIGVNMAKRLDHGYVVKGGGEFLVWAAGDFENFQAPRPELDDREGWRPQLMEVTRHLLAKGWPLRIHATYDESINNILGVFEEADKLEREAGRPGFDGIRWAIDHGETASLETLQRVHRMKGGLATQCRMAYAGEDFIERYGPAMAGRAPAYGDVKKVGLPVGLGSDATRVSSYNPWITLYWATTGKSVGGTPLLSEEHRLSRAEALFMHTRGSAWFSQEEKLKGTLSVGQYADLAVLSDDYFAVEDEAIRR
ncbi:MAG: amidohydrolase, partial [Myxococcota bacterium]